MKLEISNDSLIERLLLAGNPRDASDWSTSETFDLVKRCRLTEDDVPDLIELSGKWDEPEWVAFLNAHENHPDYQAIELLSVTAWRSLACLGVVDSAPKLLDLLNKFAEEQDDWALEEFPLLFSKFGPTTYTLLRQFGENQSNHVNARITAVNATAKIAKSNPSSTNEAIAWLIELMRNAESHPIEFNSCVLVALLDLDAKDAGEAIERAFAGNYLDVSMAGDWDSVRTELEVDELGLSMPAEPYNLLDNLRNNLGINVSKDKPTFFDGELDWDAANQYYDNAIKQFSSSPEGKEAASKNGNSYWLKPFLELGVNYLDATINNMDTEDVLEIVLSLFPRKVAVGPDSAHAIVFELRKFWEYVNRTFQLPNAAEIIEVLGDETVGLLEDALADSSNFGIGKSLFNMGGDAGFDMTNQQGIDEFILAYNESLSNQAVESHPLSPPKPAMTAD